MDPATAAIAQLLMAEPQGQAKNIGLPGATPSQFYDFYAEKKQPSNMYMLGGLGVHTDWDKFVANQRPSENVEVIPPGAPIPPFDPEAHDIARAQWIKENPGWKFLDEPIRKDPAKVRRLMRGMANITAGFDNGQR